MESNAVLDFEATAFLRGAARDSRFTGFVVPDDVLFPEIRKGDVVLVDTAQGLQETGIFAMDTPFGKTVCRLHRKVLGGVRSIWDYPEKDVLELEGEPEVVGRVVMIFRKVV
jgi:hypothetical protein